MLKLLTAFIISAVFNARVTICDSPCDIQKEEVFTCGKSSQHSGLIVRGIGFKRTDFPWMAALLDNSEGPANFICGGTLISHSHVITAAHCVNPKNDQFGIPIRLLARNVLVALGSYNLDDKFEIGRTTSSVEQILLHDDWNPQITRFESDIAMLKLEKDVTFSKYVQPICLWESKTPPSTKMGIVAGWGQSENLNVRHENIPRKLNMEIDSQINCLIHSPGLASIFSHKTFCAGYGNGSGVCSGDSGSGFFSEVDGTYFFRGIVSSSLFQGGSCDVTKKAIFTDVIQFTDWIRNSFGRKLKVCPAFPVPSKCGFRNPQGLGGVANPTNDSSTVAQFAEFPWMMAVMMKNELGSPMSFIGGGSLIHPKVVITTATLVADSPEPRSLMVRGGEYDFMKDDEICHHEDRQVASVIRHEEFSSSNLQNDLALLLLETGFELSATINTICLPFRNIKLEPLSCFTSGWGREKFSDKDYKSVQLKKIKLPIVSHRKCQGMLRKTRVGPDFKLHDKFLCAGGEEGKDTCLGDASPLMCSFPSNPEHYFLAGIVIGQIACGEKDVPGLFADITQYRQWISGKSKALGISDDTFVFSRIADDDTNIDNEWEEHWL